MRWQVPLMARSVALAGFLLVMAGCAADVPTVPGTEAVGKEASGQGDGSSGSTIDNPPSGWHFEFTYQDMECFDEKPTDYTPNGIYVSWTLQQVGGQWCAIVDHYDLVQDEGGGGDDDPPDDPPPTDFWTESVGSRGVDCGLPGSLSRAERAYCRGSAPTGVQKSYIGMVLYAMSQKSALCDSIALVVDSMIDNNRFRFFTAADTADREVAVTWKSGVPQGWVALDSAYIASRYDSGHAVNVNGTMMDLSAQLAHIGEHLLRQQNSSLHLSGQDYTPNTLGCSDLP